MWEARNRRSGNRRLEARLRSGRPEADEALVRNIAGAVEQQDAATREISSNAQLAAQGNETLVANIGSLSDAIGETNKAATSVLSASSDLTSTAEILSREVDKFFHNLRADTFDRRGDAVRRTGTAGS